MRADHAPSELAEEGRLEPGESCGLLGARVCRPASQGGDGGSDKDKAAEHGHGGPPGGWSSTASVVQARFII
jgi:hypothetical protein